MTCHSCMNVGGKIWIKFEDRQRLSHRAKAFVTKICWKRMNWKEDGRKNHLSKDSLFLNLYVQSSSRVPFEGKCKNQQG